MVEALCHEEYVVCKLANIIMNDSTYKCAVNQHVIYWMLSLKNNRHV